MAEIANPRNQSQLGNLNQLSKGSLFCPTKTPNLFALNAKKYSIQDGRWEVMQAEYIQVNLIPTEERSSVGTKESKRENS